MLESKKKGMFMSAFMVAIAVAGGILIAGVVKKNLMKDSSTEDPV
jgi:hypothetical protein